jgi:hypothetical protein
LMTSGADEEDGLHLSGDASGRGHELVRV